MGFSRTGENQMPQGFINNRATDPFKRYVKYMTEEEKKAETARLAAEAKATEEKEKADAEFEAEIADLSDEEKEAKRAERDGQSNDNKPDFEAQLKAERERRVAAEKALAEDRYHSSKRKRKDDDEDNDEDDDESDDDSQPITKKDLKNLEVNIRQSVVKETLSGRIKEAAEKLAETPAEAELIVEIHKNRSWPSSMSVEEQVEEAWAIANRKRLVSKNKELSRAIESRDGISRDNASGHRDSMKGTAPKLDKSLESSLKAQKFTYDSSRKIWKKKLPNGKFLCKDPRTKPIKTWSE